MYLVPEKKWVLGYVLENQIKKWVEHNWIRIRFSSYNPKILAIIEDFLKGFASEGSAKL